MESIICKMESSNSLIDHEEKVEKWTNKFLLNDRHHLTRIASWIWQLAKNAILYNVFSLNLREHSLETVNAASGEGKRLVLSVCHKRTALFSNKGNFYRDGDLFPDPITANLITYGLTGRVKVKKNVSFGIQTPQGDLSRALGKVLESAYKRGS